jgi:molybdopterin synthase catalytic subunit
MIHVALHYSVIDPTALMTRVVSPAVGAIASFYGTVREVNEGRAVSGIEYSAYDEMAEREMRKIASEAASRVDGLAIAMEHRLGELALGDISVAIVVAHARRAPALDACRFIIEELKRRVPIWKREHYVDGSRAWVDNRASAPREESVA